MEITVDNKVIELSEAGWLNNLEEWTEDVAITIAKEVEKVELTDDHWDIINLARDYYTANGSACEPRKFSKLMKEKYGKDKADSKYLYTLFPYGLVKCVNKIAGLQRPKGCS